MLIRQVLLRAKFFARKKHDVRVRNPRKKKISNLKKTFDLGFKFEKKKYYGMFFECLCGIKNFIKKM